MREIDDFGGFGATGKMVGQANEAAGKRWYKLYYDETIKPARIDWEAMDESGVLKTGSAPTKVEAKNAAIIAMRSLAVSKGQIPASTIVPKPVPVTKTVTPVVSPLATTTTPTAMNWLDTLIASIKNALGIR